MIGFGTPFKFQTLDTVLLNRSAKCSVLCRFLNYKLPKVSNKDIDNFSRWLLFVETAVLVNVLTMCQTIAQMDNVIVSTMEMEYNKCWR